MQKSWFEKLKDAISSIFTSEQQTQQIEPTLNKVQSAENIATSIANTSEKAVRESKSWWDSWTDNKIEPITAKSQGELLREEIEQQRSQYEALKQRELARAQAEQKLTQGGKAEILAVQREVFDKNALNQASDFEKWSKENQGKPTGYYSQFLNIAKGPYASNQDLAEKALANKESLSALRLLGFDTSVKKANLSMANWSEDRQKITVDNYKSYTKQSDFNFKKHGSNIVTDCNGFAAEYLDGLNAANKNVKVYDVGAVWTGTSLVDLYNSNKKAGVEPIFLKDLVQEHKGNARAAAKEMANQVMVGDVFHHVQGRDKNGVPFQNDKFRGGHIAVVVENSKGQLVVSEFVGMGGELSKGSYQETPVEQWLRSKVGKGYDVQLTSSAPEYKLSLINQAKQEYASRQTLSQQQLAQLDGNPNLKALSSEDRAFMTAYENKVKSYDNMSKAVSPREIENMLADNSRSPVHGVSQNVDLSYSAKNLVEAEPKPKEISRHNTVEDYETQLKEQFAFRR